ncbi:M20/M25/M40 family metallo-hydrolase [Dokdonella sp.]|uniref:M20/M25/M40 family metallo-hydrolase n=1 Tax=Dokdonella sp. TaxID=2291710 RepID=UPI00352884CF
MKHRAALLLALLLPCAVPCAAETETRIPAVAIETASELRDRALKDDVAYDIVESLTTEIGSRLAGSENDLKAREWMIAKFKALGFDKVWSEPVSFPKWVRRSESAAVVEPYPQPLTISALGGSAGTPAGGLVAEVIAFPDLEAMKAAADYTVRGKIVYIANPRMHALRDGHDYGAGSGVRVQGPEQAEAKGAAAFLLRSVGSDGNRLAHTGMTRFSNPDKAIPAAALSNPDADQLDRIIKRGKPVKLRLSLDCGTEGSYTGANIIAEFTGSQRPREYFLTGGHLDSWDVGTGAIDDAAGVAITTAAAVLIGRLPERPARSIRVVAFANEESGLYGGKAYAAQHHLEIDKVILGAESDGGADRIYAMSATVKPEARAAIGQIAEVLRPLGIDYDATLPGSGGSDLSAVHAVGMAGLSLRQDTSRYFEWHHTDNDTLDKVDPEQLRQNVAAYAVAMYLAASAEGDFGSAPGAFEKATASH